MTGTTPHQDNPQLDGPLRSKWPVILLVGLFGLILSIILFALLWGADKGFNLTDEGYYLIYYQHPERYRISMNSLPYLLHGLYQLVHGDVYWLRVARIILIGSGTIFFSANFLSLLKGWAKGSPVSSRIEQTGIQALIMIFLLIGGLTACLLGPQTISYNHVTQCSLLIMMGLICRVYHQQMPRPDASEPGSGRRHEFFWMGIVSGFQFLVKWPVSIIMLVIALITLALARLRNGLQVRKPVTELAVGASGILALYFLCVQPLPDWLAGFEITRQVMTQQGLHDPQVLLMQYAREWLEMMLFPIQKLGRELFSLISCGLLYALLNSRDKQSSHSGRINPVRVAKLLVWLALGITVYGLLLKLQTTRTLSSILTGPYADLFLLEALAILGVAAGFLLKEEKPQRSNIESYQRGWMIALLFAMPFIGLLGTSNAIGYNAYYGLVFWFALLVIALGVVGQRLNSRAFPVVFSLLSALFVLAQVGYFFYDSNRYLYAAFLPYQQYALQSYSNVRNIQVDAQTSTFINAVKAALKRSGYREGDSLIPLYDLPGLVYILGGTSPGVVWYNSYPQAMGENCAGLALAGTKQLKDTYFLVNRPVGATMQGCLQRQGVQLGRSHPAVARIPYPFAPFYNPGYYSDSLTVYAPLGSLKLRQ